MTKHSPIPYQPESACLLLALAQPFRPLLGRPIAPPCFHIQRPWLFRSA